MPTHKRLAKIYSFSVVEQASDFCNGELGIGEIFQRKNVLYLLFDCPKGTRFRFKSTPQRSFTYIQMLGRLANAWKVSAD